MSTDLNLNLLRSFFMIAEERSLTRAAARLNMSQPSVSQALQRLEEQLDRGDFNDFVLHVA